MACTEFSILHGIECTFVHDYEENALTNEMRLDFFRICQETLSDILNHEQAGKIRILIKDSGNNIELLISDSGNGFNTEISKKSTEFTSIRERARSINGIISIRKSPADSTFISLLVEKQYSETGTVITG